MDSKYWDNIAPAYDQLYTSAWSANEDLELQTWLTEIVGHQSQRRILDIGCGTGLGFHLLSQISSNFVYVGLDISAAMLATLRSKYSSSYNSGQIELVQSPASNLAQLFPAESFDAIILINAAASYAGTPSFVLSNCQRLLKPDGRVFASFLNRTSLRRFARVKCGSTEVFNTRGANRRLQGVEVIVPTSSEIAYRCRRSGLEIVWTRFQSLLGGVAEKSWLWPLELAIRRLAPSLGHTVNVLAHKRAGRSVGLR